MITYSEALAKILIAARGRTDLHIQTVDLIDTVGRIAAAPVVSDQMIPAFDNSAMDGFTVRSDLTREASVDQPISFRVLGSILAGDLAPEVETRESENGVWAIMTGAPYPRGFDATVKIEDVLVTRDPSGAPVHITIKKSLVRGENYRGRGEDVSVGNIVLNKGDLLRPEHVLSLASLGVARLSVYHRPKVGVIGTGQELVPFQTSPGPGQIRNSTSPYLTLALREAGANAVHLGTVGDDPEELKKLLDNARRERFDAVVTTGAVSMGTADYVAPTLKELGARMEFHKVAIRPGKPVLFCHLPALIRDQPDLAVFGLPGNPVSGVVGSRFFVEPWIRELMRREPERPFQARLQTQPKTPPNLRSFLKARVESVGGELVVHIGRGQMSFMVHPLLSVNAWAVIDGANDGVVDVYPLSAQAYAPQSVPIKAPTERKEGGLRVDH